MSERFRFELGDLVEVVDTTNWDAGIEKGTQGTINSMMEDPEGNRYVMFQPTGTTDFLWCAEWRFMPIVE